MGELLIISGSKNSLPVLRELFKQTDYSQIESTHDSFEARRLLSMSFDLVLINAPLKNESGIELALDAAGAGSSVIMLIKSESCDEIAQRVEASGVLVVPKPLNRVLFYQALHLINASRRQFMRLKSENERLQEKIAEIRLVDRAKCALIQYADMTEPQAHRYIEKQAMDLRRTRGDIAQSILKAYEN